MGLIEPIDCEADDSIDALLALLLARSIMSQHTRIGLEAVKTAGAKKSSAAE